MTYFLLLTAFTVSIDSFFCGFSLAFFKGRKYRIIASISLTVMLMCMVTNYIALPLSGYLNEKTANIGGFILIAVGIYNLLKKNSADDYDDKDVSIKQSLITGFAVGIDGAFANLSLSLMGINAFYVPVTIAAMHALMITLGILLAKTPPAKALVKCSFVPPLILIALGVYKLLGLFI